MDRGGRHRCKSRIIVSFGTIGAHIDIRKNLSASFVEKLLLVKRNIEDRKR